MAHSIRKRMKRAARNRIDKEKQEALKNVETCYFYVDGACDNPWVGNGKNKGGWGVIVKYQGNESIVTGSEELTTNQRMEIAGITQCLPYLLSKCIKKIQIITDSMYVIYGIRGRKKWRKRKNVPNWDLWEPIFDAIEEYKDAEITAKWVKGHSGHVENERCNDLAESVVKESSKIGFK